MTYSIVARDPASGRFGVAIQSCWPFVGAGVPWVESGVGAVATQSFTEVAHGPNGLTRLRAGEPAAEALAGLMATDPGEAVRQVGIVDAAGRAAAHTGARCVEAAGHLTAAGVSVDANMMERPTVWPAMLAAYQDGEGDFVDRLLAALRAAEAEGGDVRGRQSAALVVSGGTGRPGLEARDRHPCGGSPGPTRRARAARPGASCVRGPRSRRGAWCRRRHCRRSRSGRGGPAARPGRRPGHGLAGDRDGRRRPHRAGTRIAEWRDGDEPSLARVRPAHRRIGRPARARRAGPTAVGRLAGGSEPRNRKRRTTGGWGTTTPVAGCCNALRLFFDCSSVVGPAGR